MIETLAQKYGLEPEVVEAVNQVESGGRSGFQKSGQLTVLFEAHRFYKLLKQAGKDPDALAQKYPNLISKTWNRKLYKGGNAENKRLTDAVSIDPVAWQAASYGKFQILGEHYKGLGFASAVDYIAYLNQSEANHIDVFFRFIAMPANRAMLAALQKKDWTTFARLYNGPGFAANQYDQKMAFHYQRLIAKKAKSNPA